MPADDLVHRSALELGKLIAAGEVSSVELTTAFLRRIERLNPRINAFINVTAEQALARARLADKQAGKGRILGPLHGVPYAAKDLFATAGVRTTNGSRVSENWIPDYDSTVTARLDRAGMVLLGKLNMYEFAIGSEALSLAKPARNPWHLDYSPEGSSSGSAAAVAASLVPVSLGTDTGGSVRKPAAVNGLAGLKPSYGRISRKGVTATSWSMDHVGTLAHTVADAAAVMQVIAGHDPEDASSSTQPVPDYSQSLSGDIKGLRIGIPERFFYEGLASEVETAVRDVIEALRALGAKPVKVDIPHAQLSVSAGWIISMVEAASYHEDTLEKSPEKYSALVRERLQVAQRLKATDYLKSQRIRSLLQAQTRQAFAHCDVMIMPTTTRIGRKIQRPENALTDVVDNAGDELAFAILSAVRTTIIGTMTGIPAITVPCGFSTAHPGLPIGVQFYARPFDEPTLLRVAHAYESRHEWHRRRPQGL